MYFFNYSLLHNIASCGPSKTICYRFPSLIYRSNHSGTY